ncbi:YlxR family protein [Rhodococcus sp. X156]|uniref:YlxR family protein n=1 Tax=Rhodococcus sp. X156 TaxID=2499145 RepID=UPI0032180165
MGCRVRASTAELLRVVARGSCVIPDPQHRMTGRGAWLHPTSRCLDAAERRRALPRALRVPGPLDVSAAAALVADSSVSTTEHAHQGRQAKNS